MKKRGFTLAETLMTLGIIGIISAITLPLILKLRPDEKKIMYLKAYDSLTEIVVRISKNSRLYPSIIEFTTGGEDYVADISKIPLYNTDVSHLLNEYAGITADTKLCRLIATGMNEEVQGCSNTVNASGNSISWDIPSYTTKNGMAWIIGKERETTLPTQGADGKWRINFEYAAWVKLKQNGNECIYSDNCKDPNVFKFFITADGQVYAADRLGQQYLNARSSLQKVKFSENAINNVELFQPVVNIKIPVYVKNSNCQADEYWDGTTNSCKKIQNEELNQNQAQEPSASESTSTSDSTSDSTNTSTNNNHNCGSDQYWDGYACADNDMHEHSASN